MPAFPTPRLLELALLSRGQKGGHARSCFASLDAKRSIRKYITTLLLKSSISLDRGKLPVVLVYFIAHSG
jgi:hypothetical protein